jgi:hypothetical protein
LNRAQLQWFSKKQNSVETSTFGSEFAALQTAVELTKAMRYKLRMMGIPIDCPAHFRVDNMSVVHNTQSPESTLKKKSNAISYHFVREAIASRILRVAYEESSSNKADILIFPLEWFYYILFSTARLNRPYSRICFAT